MKIGIDLGGSHIGIGVIDANGHILETVEKRLLPSEKKEIIVVMEQYITEQVNRFRSRYDIQEIGMAIPGTVTKKEVVKSVNLGLKNYPIVTRLEEKLQLPISIRNDAKCAAIAEHHLGVLKEFERAIFLGLGTGIGGAVLVNHQLLDTGELPGCEFGHMIIGKDGNLCACGNKGCFETYASMKAYKMKLRKVLGTDERTSGEELLAILRKEGNRKDLQEVTQEFIQYLSIGIANLVNIFEPEAIAIGGSFVYFEDILLEPLKRELKEGPYLFNARDEIRILPAVLGNQAGILGACL